MKAVVARGRAVLIRRLGIYRAEQPEINVGSNLPESEMTAHSGSINGIVPIAQLGICDVDFISMSEARRWAAKDVAGLSRPAIVLSHHRPVAVMVPYSWFLTVQDALVRYEKALSADAVDPHVAK